MWIFFKNGILHTLKFHLHTLSCHFWLNLCTEKSLIWSHLINDGSSNTEMALMGHHLHAPSALAADLRLRCSQISKSVWSQQRLVNTRGSALSLPLLLPHTVYYTRQQHWTYIRQSDRHQLASWMQMTWCQMDNNHMTRLWLKCYMNRMMQHNSMA